MEVSGQKTTQLMTPRKVATHHTPVECVHLLAQAQKPFSRFPKGTLKRKYDECTGIGFFSKFSPSSNLMSRLKGDKEDFLIRSNASRHTHINKLAISSA